jgi:phosphodiesterase/alkaline phosphatase D-like protein
MKLFTLAAILMFGAYVGMVQASATSPSQTPNATTAAQPQVTHGPVVEYASDHDAVLAWTTKQPFDIQVHYGTSASSLTQASDVAEHMGGTNHRVQINNLQPSTTYFFQLTTNTGQPIGSVYSFQTVAKGATPVRQVNLGPK